MTSRYCGVLIAACVLTATAAFAGPPQTAQTARAVAASTRLVTLDVQKAPVRALLQEIADAGGVNLVVADDVGGAVTLKADGVSWRVALEAVAAAARLSYRVEGDILWVELNDGSGAAPPDLVDEDCAARAPLSTRLVPVRYGRAEDMAKVVATTLSQRGTVSVDRRTNTLVIHDVDCPAAMR